MIENSFPYPSGVPASANQVFIVSNNLMYFDRSNSSAPPFRAQAGCIYSGGFPYIAFQDFTSNLYWRTDGAFASDPLAFRVQANSGPGPNAPCSDVKNTWTFYTFAQWQATFGEDVHSVVQNPGFANPSYPADDYSLPNGSPGVGFVPFDPSLAGRRDPVLNPPAIPATFPTQSFNPATDY